MRVLQLLAATIALEVEADVAGSHGGSRVWEVSSYQVEANRRPSWIVPRVVLGRFDGQ